MNHYRVHAAAWSFLLFASTVSAAAPGGIEGALRQVVEANLAGYNSENPSQTLATVHTKSPAYASMQDALPRQFGALETRAELEGFSYIGHDDEFAVARVQYRTVGGKTRPFMNNLMDTITVFHQEAGTWKYWDNYVLGVRPIQ